MKNIINRVPIAARVLLGKEIPRPKRKDSPAISPEDAAEIREIFTLIKFFIFGHARSGTTMLARLVRLHPEVHCNYQAHFFTRKPLLESLVADTEISEWLSRDSNRWNHGRDLSPVVLRVAADYILEREARLEGKRIVGDKSPNSLLDGEAVRLMYNIYPDGYLIYILRDGRDTIISHRFQSFIDFPQHLSKEDLKIRAHFAKNPEPYLCGERSIFTEKGLYRAAAGWVRNVTETHQTGSTLYKEHYHSLRYEDLLEQTWDEMVRVWTFLGVSDFSRDLKTLVENESQNNPDAEWQHQKASDIAQPLQKGKKGTWRELFTAQDKEIFNNIAGETLKTWGYALK